MDCLDVKQAALVMSQAAAAFVKATAMATANRQAAANGQSEPYSEQAFDRLVEEHGLGWNAVITTLRGGF